MALCLTGRLLSAPALVCFATSYQYNQLLYTTGSTTISFLACAGLAGDRCAYPCELLNGLAVTCRRPQHLCCRCRHRQAANPPSTRPRALTSMRPRASPATAAVHQMGSAVPSTAPLCLSSRLLIALAPDRVCWAFPCWTVSHLHPEGALQQHVASQFKQPRLSHDLTVLLCLAGGLLHTLALVPVLWRLRIKLHTYTQDERSKQHVA